MKKLFLILIAFFLYQHFRKILLIVNKENKLNIQKRAHPTAGVGLRVFGAETGGGTPIGSATYCWSRAIW